MCKAALTLKLTWILHKVSDLRYRGFPEALCDFQRQQTALVDAAGQGFIAFADASRHRFAGQCLGVQHGFAIHNDAIQRDFFTGFYHDDLAHRNAFRRNDLQYAIPLNGRRIRTDVHKVRDGLSGTLYRQRLEELSDLIEQHNCNSFRVFPDGKCADRGNTHQEMLVKHLSSGDIFHCLPYDIPAKNHIRHNQKRQFRQSRQLCEYGQCHTDCIDHSTHGKPYRALLILIVIHYFMGGIQVDERHRTSMRNLYAAGECCAQYHGANRLGGNSLLGAIYGGQIAAETACRETVSSPNMPCAEESLLPELSPDAQMQMNRILLNALGVVRDAQTLEAGIQEIRKLSGTLPLLGCAMLESALARKESRGAHWRADYPQRSDAVYCKTTVAHWNGQHIAISFESIPERRHDL